MNVGVIVAVVAAGASIIGAFFGFIATWSMNRAQAAKALADSQKANAEVVQIAQTTARAEALAVQADLEKRVSMFAADLAKLQEASLGMVDAVEAYMDEDSPTSDSRRAVKLAIWKVRQAV